MTRLARRRWKGSGPSGIVVLAVLVLSACAGGPSSPGGPPDLPPAPGEPGGAVPAPAAAGEPADLPSAAGAGLFRGDGTPVEWAELVEAATEVRVVLLGEVHDDEAGHSFRARFLRDLGEVSDVPPVLSMEMFERDVQPVLDEYLGGWITEEQFLAASRPWPNYREHYAPMVEWAREEGAPVIAANPPRRWVNRVTREGRGALDSIPDHAAPWLPPIPWDEASPAYREQWDEQMARMAGAHGHGHGHGAAGPDPEDLLAAQTLWDAGMAHSIAMALDAHPGAAVVHVAGAFHVQWGTGIPEHLEAYRPGTSTLVMVVVPAADPSEFDPEAHRDLGDFVILTPGG
ncbi:MAG: hypothetical protein EA352_07785 [Gemmatimonadales bacterium]|nr:MAG: hypothetical protein EA352_07785 [Gemmatimonadales bacterium]